MIIIIIILIRIIIKQYIFLFKWFAIIVNKKRLKVKTNLKFKIDKKKT